TMTDLADVCRLPAENRIAIRFALGEVADRRGVWAAAFAHYRAGNDARQAALAARGKVFDPDAIDATVDAVIQAFPAGSIVTGGGDPTDRPVFVVGMPRSGTSLVEQILASHPDVDGAGEAMAVAGAIPDDPAAWPDLDASATAAAALARLVGDVARIVDKTPFQFLHLGLIRRLFPNAAIVHCRRDPLDTGLSCYFQNFVADHPWATDLAHIGCYHGAYARLMAHWAAVLPGALHTVDYEALVADPEAESRRLIAAVGLEWDDACLSPQATQRTVLTASSWQVRQAIHAGARGRAAHYAAQLKPLRDALAGG
ncbi:MAG: sulfotransferase, partial [Rickettsiales bacterium]